MASSELHFRIESRHHQKSLGSDYLKKKRTRAAAAALSRALTLLLPEPTP